MGPETVQWDGSLTREGVGVEKIIPSLESSFPPFEPGENKQCPQDVPGIIPEFCKDVLDPWGCAKTSCKIRLCFVSASVPGTFVKFLLISF